MLDIDGTRELLNTRGFDDSYLQQVREKETLSEVLRYCDPADAENHYCDYCGRKLDCDYEVQKDGRERCSECSKTAIRRKKEFKELYLEAHKSMESIFKIKITVPIKIKMTTAKKVNEHFGLDFKPTPGFDGRVLGFAQKMRNGYTIYVENGAPRVRLLSTLVHELTHIWQYSNMQPLFEGGQDPEVVEGMAVWAEIQYLLLVGEKDFADRYALTRRNDDSEYGRGFLRYEKKFGLAKKGRIRRKTPFRYKDNPLKKL